MSDVPPKSSWPRFFPAGDQALAVELGPCADRTTNAKVRWLAAALRTSSVPGVLATVPSYRSLLVYYDPGRLGYAALIGLLSELMSRTQSDVAPARRWVLPVLYGEECDADLQALACQVGMDVDQVLALHTGCEYMVYMVGFSPGFAYLGELPEALQVPRKTVPAPLVPADSIQIAAAQTAVSSMPMPSGWYVVGRTPARLYDPSRAEPFLLRGGDLVRFVPTSPAEFDRMGVAARGGELLFRGDAL